MPNLTRMSTTGTLAVTLLLAVGGCAGKSNVGSGVGGAAGGDKGGVGGGPTSAGGTTGGAGSAGGTTGAGGSAGGVTGAGGTGGRTTGAAGSAAGTNGAAGMGGLGGKAGHGGSGGIAGTAGQGGAGGAPVDAATGGACIGSSLLAALGKGHLLVGVSTSDTTAAEAPFDLRYIYLSGGLFDAPTPCTACGSSCVASGKACTSGCAWWGCYDSPPGGYAASFIQTCLKASPAQIPMFTYYEILQTAEATFSEFTEGAAEVTQAATSTALMTRYFADWRFLLQAIGQHQALLHIEPDFWGYARQAGSPTALAAAVASANPIDCSSLPNTIAGMGQCMIAMVRKYAPNALVGLSASAWNVAGNTSATADVTTDAKVVAAFLGACGSADFVVVETSDRDAGYYQTVQSRDTWWDPTDATLPDYKQDLAWIKALTEGLGAPALYWQTPLGNANQNNTANHYQDNRVDYFFGGSAAQTESAAAVTVPAHWSQLAASHVIGVAFGAGAGDQTAPDTDGGNLIAKTKAYVSAGGQALCP